MEKPVTQPRRPRRNCISNWICPRNFSRRRDEKLFLEYTESQKQRAIPRLLATGLIFQLFAALVPGELHLIFPYVLNAVATIANVTLLALYYYLPSKRAIISHLAWFVMWAQLLISALRRQGEAYNELLGWASILQYFTIATLPFRALTLLLYSFISMIGYLAVQIINGFMFETTLTEDFWNQEICNGSILITASLLGATAFIIYNHQHRRSFVVTKKSLRDRLTIDQQSKEQERLLLSVLPEHVAVQMRQELGLIDTQFKKIYMSRHENVSILYADIVGFTAISSTYSAQDLVAILNELFARFDRLAEKYQQLRIKILGDCYYCISGAPVERPDHAVLCVHMGLSMVKAIKYVQQTTNSPVDMRVGIHTGAVLAGVLGQRQWQFDVYSRDVELANKMESSGMAGRVHVSEVTLGFLKDEFEVEPAFGEKREEMLRQAGIKTYFIVKVLKPYGDEKTVEGAAEGADEERGDTLSDLRDEEDSVLSTQREKKESEDKLIYDMLEEELQNRDDDKELKVTGLCLGFKTYEAEKLYLRRGNTSPAPVLVPPMLLAIPLMVLAFYCVPPKTLQITYIYYIIMVLTTNLVYFCSYRYMVILHKPYNPEYRVAYNLMHVTVYSVITLMPLLQCGMLEENLLDDIGANGTSYVVVGYRCAHPSYYYHMASGGLCSVMFIIPASCMRRLVVLIFSATYYLGPSIWLYGKPVQIPRADLDRDPFLIDKDNSTLPYSLDTIQNLEMLHRYRHFIMIYMLTLCISIFDRYLESMERARHLRGERMRQQAEQAGDLRKKNQALVYNVLPPHVARHFMGAHRNHRDLYSQSYAEVGVLFASMPNFTEFYSEETVNNQGLECLRFLNEVISDFDSLLEEKRYRDIIKIKTISSTYMAASGLNPIKDADTTVPRWGHLMCLVEFALELQRVLAAINEQSFNHFVLRMGVNHGPITAGVIGAKKPHYDIWGNTVNVASRMESTGKAGCIQVTEETCHILQHFGYYFEQRGLVAVKGKGQLMTYYLQGRNKDKAPPLAIGLTDGSDCVIQMANGGGDGGGDAASGGVAVSDADDGGAVGRTDSFHIPMPPLSEETRQEDKVVAIPLLSNEM